MDIAKYIRDLRRAVNDPESYWPINAANSLASAGPAASQAESLVTGWSSSGDGMALVFETAPSIYVADSTTPANDTDLTLASDGLSDFSDFLTYTNPFPKMVMQSDGFVKYAAHNLYLNSGTPANQSITLDSGHVYAITITGTVSVTASGAATGTWTAGTTTFTAATTTLTLGSTSGTGTVQVYKYPADTTYIETTGSIRYALPLQYSSGVAEGLLVEPAATNLCPDSNDLSGASWVNINSTDASASQTLPDGTIGGHTITASGGSGRHIIYDTLNPGAGNTVFSVVLKAGTTDYVQLHIGSTILSYGVLFDLSNGTILSGEDQITGSPTFTLSDIEDLGGGWYRCIVGVQTLSTTNYANICLSDSATPSYDGNKQPTFTPAGTPESVHFYHAQIESGSTATSLIITTGATETRAVDNITKAVSALPYVGDEESLYAKFSASSITANRGPVVIGSGNNDRVLIETNNSRQFYVIADGNGYFVDGGTLTADTTAKVAGAVRADDIAVSVDGGTAVVGNTTGGIMPATHANLYLGRVTTTDPSAVVSQLIKEIAYYPERLRNEYLEAITAGTTVTLWTGSEAEYWVNGETDALSLDFLDDHWQATTGYYGSAYVIDTSVEGYDSHPDGLLTYTNAHEKFVMGPSGTLRYAPHNLYLNSASPANQSVTVVAGETYTISVTGTVSITVSGAATGTVTAGNDIDFTAATTTLTCGSTSGAGTVHVYRTPADETYIATSGSAAYGLPFEWYTSGSQRGLLIEPQATNLVSASQDFSSGWTNTNSSDVADAVGPDGASSSATTLTATGGSGIHAVFRSLTSLSLSTNYVLSLYVKAGGTNNVGLLLSNSGATSGVIAKFHLDTEDFGSDADIGSPTITLNNKTIDSVGNGWYRITAAYTSDASDTGARIYVYALDSSDNTVYTPAGTPESIEIYGAQFETGSVPTSLIRTYGATETRDSDQPTLALSEIPFDGAASRSWFAEFQAKDATVGYALDTGPDRDYVFWTSGSVSSAAHSGGAKSALGTVVAGTVHRVANGAETNNFTSAFDGTVAAADTSFTPTAGATTLYIGHRLTNVQQLNGHMRRLVFVPRRVSDTDLDAWTTTGDLP